MKLPLHRDYLHFRHCEQSLAVARQSLAGSIGDIFNQQPLTGFSDVKKEPFPLSGKSSFHFTDSDELQLFSAAVRVS